MSITLNNYTFDSHTTSVREDHQEIAGQDGRNIRISGVFVGLADVASIEAALDAVLAAASDDEEGLLSLRSGRQLHVRRLKFTREVQQDGLVGRYELTLRAENPFEESSDATIVPWTITASGATRAITSSGTAPTPALLIVQATGDLVSPTFGDGVRALSYHGLLSAGSVLEIDGVARQARLDGDDVTPYVSGEFPLLLPGANTLSYDDAPASSHLAQVAICFNARWW